MDNQTKYLIELVAIGAAAVIGALACMAGGAAFVGLVAWLT